MGRIVGTGKVLIAPVGTEALVDDGAGRTVALGPDGAGYALDLTKYVTGITFTDEGEPTP